MTKIIVPNMDEVFSKWVDKLSESQISKIFGMSKDAISAAELVKETERHLIFSFDLIIGGKQKRENRIVKLNELKKLKFYIFPKSVNHKDWKGPDEVAYWEEMELSDCGTCSATGSIICKDCNGKGTKACKTCGGTGFVECKKCGGTGKKEIKVKVKTYGKGEEEKIIKVQCDYCFGTGKIGCDRCNGTGRILCDTCEGLGKQECSRCDGFGKVAYVPVGTPPFEEGRITEWVIDKSIKKAIETKNIKLESLQYAEITSLEKLDEKNVKELVGFVTKNLKSQIKDFQKIFKKYQEDYKHKKGSPLKKPETPIRVIPIIALNVQTPKKKKFKIFAIGTQEKYILQNTKI